MNNLFLNTLQELRKGVVVGELSDELVELVEAVRDSIKLHTGIEVWLVEEMPRTGGEA